MKLRARVLLALLGAVMLGATALAQDPEIVDFGNGVLTWTNAGLDGVFTVQWASALTGTWHSSWNSLREQAATGTTMTAAIPMFYRVVGSPVGVEWQKIEQLHNAADSTGYGGINYSFIIGKYEVSNDQYAQFLNTVDPGGTNPLSLFHTSMAASVRGGISNNTTLPEGSRYLVKPNMGDKPVIYVSFWDAARFCNWLHNGQAAGGTESGAYELSALSPANSSVSRTPHARYFLPNEDEWYKAAYYDPDTGGYALYPVGSDGVPAVGQADSVGQLVNTNSKVANYYFGAVWNSASGNVTTVGSGGTNNLSFYGVADMGGNVQEWVEDIVETDFRVVRGGSWFSVEGMLRSSCRNGFLPSLDLSSVGFRVASSAAGGAAALGGGDGDDGGDGGDDDFPPVPP